MAMDEEQATQDEGRDVTNEDSAQRGRNAIDAYIVDTGSDREGALIDLLADLMHMTHIDCEPGVPFDEALDTAQGHFEAEVKEE